MNWDESSSAYIAEGPRMRLAHAGVRAAEGGGHVFFHTGVCASECVRACVRRVGAVGTLYRS